MQSAGLYDSFDRSNGNGSRNAEEDWLDEHSTAAENQWSTAETTFYYWEASASQQKKFEQLYDKHHGKGESDRLSTIRRSQIVSDAETFCSILELPEPESKRVLRIARSLNFSSNRFGGKKYEKVLLGICSLVSDESLSRRLSEKSNSRIINERLVFQDEFKELMEANGLSSQEHNSIRQMLRERTDEF
jgi:hypothetical protein